MNHARWQLAHGRAIDLDRPAVIAILNTTPDSFSDGGDLHDPAAAAQAADAAVRDGAAMLDIGGESTRPGASRVAAAEQIRRVVPAIRAIRKTLPGIPISIDTTLASVAAAAIEAGADAINDVAAGTEDPNLLLLAARAGVGVILMHRLRPPAADNYSNQYATPPDYAAAGGVVAAVRSFLAERATAAQNAGVSADRIVLDPGLGFGKTVEQNLDLIRGTPVLMELGFPVLSALSRKSFTAAAGGIDPSRPPKERLAPTLALSVLHAANGARLFRVHDVRPHVEALSAAAAVNVNVSLSDEPISALRRGRSTSQA